MKIAILGATGLVGRTMLDLVAGRPWADGEPLLLTSARSAGCELPFRDRRLVCRDAAGCDFAGFDLVLASAGAGPSRELAPRAAAAGAWVVDNSSAFRREPDVPLVVPEINGDLLDALRLPPRAGRGGIVANPNCSTIQIAMAIAPLRVAFGLREVHVTTLQSVSGVGQKGVDELLVQERDAAAQSAADPAQPGAVFPRRIAANAIPAIGRADADGWFEEETKVRHELRKIFDIAGLAVTCTATRVPVVVGHAAACRVVCEREVSRRAAVDAIRRAPGVTADPDPAGYRTPAEIAGETLVYVGRVRRDPDRRDALLFWVVADNLLKGAAWNAVQIADRLVVGRG